MFHPMNNPDDDQGSSGGSMKGQDADIQIQVKRKQNRYTDLKPDEKGGKPSPPKEELNDNNPSP